MRRVRRLLGYLPGCPAARDRRSLRLQSGGASPPRPGAVPAVNCAGCVVWPRGAGDGARLHICAPGMRAVDARADRCQPGGHERDQARPPDQESGAAQVFAVQAGGRGGCVSTERPPAGGGHAATAAATCGGTCSCRGRRQRRLSRRAPSLQHRLAYSRCPCPRRQCNLCYQPFHVLCGRSAGQALAFRLTDGEPLAFCGQHSAARFARRRDELIAGAPRDYHQGAEEYDDAVSKPGECGAASKSASVPRARRPRPLVCVASGRPPPDCRHRVRDAATAQHRPQQ